MRLAYRDLDNMSGSWSIMKKSKCNESFYVSQEFEDVDSLQNSLDAGRIRSLSLPHRCSDDLSKSWVASRRQETYIEMIKDLGTNLKYNLGYLGQSIWAREGGNLKKAYMLGKEYDIYVDGEEKQEELMKMKKAFSEIIWFSYRKNFPKLNYNQFPDEESYVSDTGWGCTLRSCQMMFAECLKKSINIESIKKKYKLDSKLKPWKNGAGESQISAKKLRNCVDHQIVSWFLDCQADPKLAPYSIQKISSYIYENSNIRPGNWLKPSTVMYAFQSIHENLSSNTVPNMQLEIYLEGTIYINQAVKKVASSNPDDSPDQDFVKEFEIIEDNDENQNLSDRESITSETSHKEHTEVDDIPKERPFVRLFQEDAEEAERLLKQKWKDSLMIVVLAKIGLEKPNPEYLPFIKELLSFPESVGMLGGKPGLAYFIVGHMEDRLMYLDPHFVQEAIQNKKDLKDNLNTYYCNSVRYLSLYDIDTSVGFGFWIKDHNHFKKFVQRFKIACQRKDSFLGIEVYAPEEDVGEFESVNGEDEFETIALK